VDIDRRTYNLDPSLIEAAITTKTRAILPVSLYGQCADFDTINAFAAKNGIPVIEMPARVLVRPIGEEVVRSLHHRLHQFFPFQPLGCYGDGGACFTDNDDLATRIRQIRVHVRTAVTTTLSSGERKNGYPPGSDPAGQTEVFPDELGARSRHSGKVR